jgi:hypothetical protein
MAEPVLPVNQNAEVGLWPLDAEKSDGGRREKSREKDKTTVGWRAFEVLKPRSWYPGPETSRWGPETQVLISRSWNLTLRSWNPGPESVRALLIGWSNSLGACVRASVRPTWQFRVLIRRRNRPGQSDSETRQRAHERTGHGFQDLGSQLWGLDFHTRGFQDRTLKTFKTWFSGCGISILGSHLVRVCVRACVRACVRPSDATVPRFNSPAESARTVGRTDGQTDFLRENRPGQTASV